MPVPPAHIVPAFPDILRILEVIASLKVGDKIGAKADGTVWIDRAGITQALTRAWAGSTLDDSIVFLNKVFVDVCVRILAGIGTQEDVHHVQLRAALRRAAGGLASLRLTYLGRDRDRYRSEHMEALARLAALMQALGDGADAVAEATSSLVDLPEAAKTDDSCYAGESGDDETGSQKYKAEELPDVASLDETAPGLLGSGPAPEGLPDARDAPASAVGQRHPMVIVEFQDFVEKPDAAYAMPSLFSHRQPHITDAPPMHIFN